jgi:hypothetical protein
MNPDNKEVSAQKFQEVSSKELALGMGIQHLQGKVANVPSHSIFS